MTTLPFMQDMTKDLDNLRAEIADAGNIDAMMQLPWFRNVVDARLDAITQSWADAQNAADAEARRGKLRVIK